MFLRQKHGKNGAFEFASRRDFPYAGVDAEGKSVEPSWRRNQEISRSMEARLIRPAVLAVLLMVSMGASYRGANFVVETADPQMAARISVAAEQFRHDLAIEWLGQAMPNWAQPCMMTVQIGPNLGAGGATTFVFDQRRGLWLADDDPRLGRAGVGFRVAARDHAHDFRQLLPPSLAPLGRRRRRHERRAYQREAEAPADARAVPPHAAAASPSARCSP